MTNNNLSQEELEKQGAYLSGKAHVEGLKALTDDEAVILLTYEEWKDGADWDLLEDMAQTWNDSLMVRDYLRLSFSYK